jgi:hypothetical protein
MSDNKYLYLAHLQIYDGKISFETDKSLIEKITDKCIFLKNSDGFLCNKKYLKKDLNLSLKNSFYCNTITALNLFYISLSPIDNKKVLELLIKDYEEIVSKTKNIINIFESELEKIEHE